MSARVAPLVRCFFEARTSTAQYVVSCPQTKKTAIIDPVLDFDMDGGRTFTESADILLAYIKEENLSVTHLLETHVHADHITSSHYLQQRLDTRPPVAISENVVQVQKKFAQIYDINMACDGSQFDMLLKDGETFKVGELDFQVMSTPGHTPACLSYLIPDQCIFVGDTLFMVGLFLFLCRLIQ